MVLFILNQLDTWEKKGEKRDCFLARQIFLLQGKKIELTLRSSFYFNENLTMRLKQGIVFVSQGVMFLLWFLATHELFFPGWCAIVCWGLGVFICFLVWFGLSFTNL